MKKYRAFIAAAVLAAGLAVVWSACAAPSPVEAPRALPPEQTIIPKPLLVQRQAGAFALSSARRIAVPAGEAEFAAAGRFLADRLRTVFGLELSVSDAPPVESTPIVFLSRGGGPDAGPEGYELSVTPAAVSVSAENAAGAFHGIQTLLQLLPPEAFGSAGSALRPLTVPCVRIVDKPR
ncbi:MAG: glycoside hydrolase family 20 zincin-like fold domain-containing protein, partial [Candidatus Aminicenantes bacterium]|nr:glycoside hydrolase family 20 zincin-like fold domain-containing protein [Candidatus Aminicenantes bacterium]